MKIILLTSLLSIPVLAAMEFPPFFVGVKGGYQWALDDNYNLSNSAMQWITVCSLQDNLRLYGHLGADYSDMEKRNFLQIKTMLLSFLIFSRL